VLGRALEVELAGEHAADPRLQRTRVLDGRHVGGHFAGQVQEIVDAAPRRQQPLAAGSPVLFVPNEMVPARVVLMPPRTKTAMPNVTIGMSPDFLADAERLERFGGSLNFKISIYFTFPNVIHVPLRGLS
jgi:hypothetical protein